MTPLTIAVVAEDGLAEMNVRLVGTPIAQEGGSTLRWIDRLPFKEIGKLHHGAFGKTRRYHGTRNGTADEVIVRKAVDVLEQGARPDVVVIARDLDRVSDRLTSLLEGARKARPDGTVVIAAMQPEAEAWRICAFRPKTAAERTLHEATKKTLAFDPVREPERLSSASNTDRTRDSKWVHRELFNGDIERSHAALQRPIAELRIVAPLCGLPRFIDHFATALASAATSATAN